MNKPDAGAGDAPPMDAIMFEIYRDRNRPKTHQVIYYTELDGLKRDDAIARAMEGQYVYGGFLHATALAEAKNAVQALAGRLDRDPGLQVADIQRILAPYLSPRAGRS